MRGAASAVPMVIRTITAPMMPIGLRHWRPIRGRRRVSSTGVVAASARRMIAGAAPPVVSIWLIARSSLLDPWVEQGIDQVHREIDEHKGGGQVERGSLDEGIVAVEDRLQ